ncbi:MAG: hypothetical protein K2N52_01510, partial [Clostridia bacterium]|nr:hypothetical protein [Clostridia bacterium]
MHGKTVKKVSAVSVDKLQKVVGTFDENLNDIMRGLGVIIRVDGLDFIVEGEDKNAAKAASVLESLLTLTENGEAVDKNRVMYCIELAHDG